MAKVVYESRESAAIVPLNYAQLGRLAGIGAVIGLLSWGLGHLFDAFVFKALLCGGDVPSLKCDNSYQYANASAMLIAAGVGLFGLVRFQLYRPLLIGLMSTLALWSVLDRLWSLQWYVALICVVVIFALTYAAFTWLARIRSFLIALGASIILLVVIRAVLGA